MVRKVTLDELHEMAAEAREAIWAEAAEYGREPKVYLHWTAGHYADGDENQMYLDDYHIAIDWDGGIYVDHPLDETLAHTFRRNTGSIGVTLTCAYNANTNDLGEEPPTDIQIETMAQVVWKLCDALWLTVDLDHVMSHGEAADNCDGLRPHTEYGPQADVQRWDLQYLGTEDSPYYTADHSDPITGANVIRGKAIWYKQTYGGMSNE
jgi:hypothetical protein